ncbi:MAG: hypothetical protein WCI18_05300 [Pseudomonadota bacterium]
MNYGEGITWIIVFKCSLHLVAAVGRKIETQDALQAGSSYDSSSDDPTFMEFPKE